MPKKEKTAKKKVIKKTTKKSVEKEPLEVEEESVVEVEKKVITDKYSKYNVELIQVGPLSGEYRFKTKNTNELGWQVSARDLDEAYEKADKVPAGLRR